MQHVALVPGANMGFAMSSDQAEKEKQTEDHSACDDSTDGADVEAAEWTSLTPGFRSLKGSSQR
jgi:hypothetical protein